MEEGGGGRNARRTKKIIQKGGQGQLYTTGNRGCAGPLPQKKHSKMPQNKSRGINSESGLRCKISTKSVAAITIKMRENFLCNCCNIFQIHSSEYKI